MYSMFVTLLCATAQCMEKQWDISYDAENNGYYGTQIRYPESYGAKRLYMVNAFCVNGIYTGSDINNGCDGQQRQLNSKYAKKYFEKFKALYNRQPENAS